VNTSTKAFEDDARVSAALEALRSLARREADDQVVVRHGIGQVVFDLRSDGTYGDEVVNHLAKSVRLAPASLYRAAKLYEAFPSGELEVVRTRFRQADLELNFSTLVELSAVQDRVQREIALDQVLTNRWSVRQLKVALKAKTASTTPTLRGPSPVAAGTTAAEPTIATAADTVPADAPERSGMGPAAAQALRALRECVQSLEQLIERAPSWAHALTFLAEERTPERRALMTRAHELVAPAYDQLAAVYDAQPKPRVA
jgi:hypothetical protein